MLGGSKARLPAQPQSSTDQGSRACYGEHPARPTSFQQWKPLQRLVSFDQESESGLQSSHLPGILTLPIPA